MSLLIQVGRDIPRIVIHVYEGAIDRGDTLDHVLQTLADVMGIAQPSLPFQDDVYFDIQEVASIIGPQVLDFEDRFGESHGHVEKNTLIDRRCSRSGEMANVLACGSAPVPYDVD